MVNDLICFVDSAAKVVQPRELPIDLEFIVLSTKRDVIIAVIQEPLYQDKGLSTVNKVASELCRIQKLVTDVKVYFKCGPLGLSGKLSPGLQWTRLTGAICETEQTTYCVQFLTKKKLFGSHVDCCYITLYICATLDCYRDLVQTARRGSNLRLIDSFPASQVLYLHESKSEVYSSVVLNLRENNLGEAEMLMRQFALIA